MASSTKLSLEKTMTIAAISVLPYLVALTLALIPVYLVQKQALLGSAWKDSLLWLASVVVYFGASVGFMYIPWF